jgi:hypothetical protein
MGREFRFHEPAASGAFILKLGLIHGFFNIRMPTVGDAVPIIITPEQIACRTIADPTDRQPRNCSNCLTHSNLPARLNWAMTVINWCVRHNPAAANCLWTVFHAFISKTPIISRLQKHDLQTPLRSSTAFCCSALNCSDTIHLFFQAFSKKDLEKGLVWYVLLVREDFQFFYH